MLKFLTILFYFKNGFSCLPTQNDRIKIDTIIKKQSLCVEIASTFRIAFVVIVCGSFHFNGIAQLLDLILIEKFRRVYSAQDHEVKDFKPIERLITIKGGKTFFSCSMDLNKSLILFTNPSARAGYDTRSIFEQSLTGLNSEFFFCLTSCLTKAEEPSLSYYLPIAGGRIIGFIPFPRVLMLREMQSVSSRIWTRVAVSISFDDNHYTTGTLTNL